MGDASPYMDYTASLGENIMLVGKPSGPIPRGSIASMPPTIGVGQMKLEAPPQYSGKRQLSVHIWLNQMERCMKLMQCAPTDWLGVIAMRMEDATSFWVNTVLQDVAKECRLAFRMWWQFKDVMV